MSQDVLDKPVFTQGLQLTPGAGAGLVLVSDGSGNGSWASVPPAATAVITNPATTARNVIQATADVVPLTLKDFSGQTANLMEFRDSANTLVLEVKPGGQVGVNSLRSVGGSATRIDLAGGTSYGAIVNSTATGSVGLFVRGVGGQTANLQEWQNATPTTVASVSNGGTITGLVLVANGGGTVTTNLTVQTGAVDLSAVSGTTAAAGTGIGDKIALYSAGASGYGLGIQASTLVAYLGGAGAVFAVRQASGSGNASSGSNAVTLSAAGNVDVTGQYRVGGSQIAASNLSNGVTGSGAIVLASGPTLTGTPAAPTAAVNTNTTQIATTAFVVGQASASAPLMDGSATVGTSLRYSREDHVHPTDTSRAAAASPTFTGVMTVPQINVTTSGIHFSGSSGNDLFFDTSIGTKIGSNSLEKLAFWGSTPVVADTGWGSPAGIAGAVKALTASSDMGDIRDYLLTLAATLKTYGLLKA